MKSLTEFLSENKNISSKLPEEMVSGDEVTIKVKGKKYLVKHFQEDDGSYGKFHVFLDDKPVALFDYGAGHKFHGYDFDKKQKAYNALKNFFDSL